MLRKFLLPLIFISFVYFAAAPAVFAQVSLDPSLYPKGSATISGEEPPADALSQNVETIRLTLTMRIVNVVLGIAGVIAVYSIITNGWWLIAAGGQEEKITQHKKGLTWALVGLILIILSYSIIRFIISIPFSADEQISKQAPQAQSGVK